MLQSDPSYSTLQNCQLMCCQSATLDQKVLRQRAKQAHEAIVRGTIGVTEEEEGGDHDDNFQRSAGATSNKDINASDCVYEMKGSFTVPEKNVNAFADEGDCNDDYSRA